MALLWRHSLLVVSTGSPGGYLVLLCQQRSESAHSHVMPLSSIQLFSGSLAALFLGAVGNLEDVEALETWEEHRGRVPPHLQQHPQHEDRQPAEPRLPTASPP